MLDPPSKKILDPPLRSASVATAPFPLPLPGWFFVAMS